MNALVQAVDLLREVDGSHPPLLVDVRWSVEGPDRAGGAREVGTALGPVQALADDGPPAAAHLPHVDP
jgi:hypothetical protein